MFTVTPSVNTVTPFLNPPLSQLAKMTVPFSSLVQRPSGDAMCTGLPSPVIVPSMSKMTLSLIALPQDRWPRSDVLPIIWVPRKRTSKPPAPFPH